MPLLAHLVELRGRLLKSVIAIIVLFFIFFSVKEHIYVPGSAWPISLQTGGERG